MTVKEFAQLTGLTPPMVNRRVKKGKFYVEGFGYFIAKKSGPHKSAPYDIQAEAKLKKLAPPTVPDSPDVPAAGENCGDGKSKEDLQKEKLAAEIDKINTTNERLKMMHFQECSNLQLEVFLDAFAPFKAALKKAKLTREQASELNESIESCMNTYSKTLLQKMRKLLLNS